MYIQYLFIYLFIYYYKNKLFKSVFLELFCHFFLKSSQITKHINFQIVLVNL